MVDFQFDNYFDIELEKRGDSKYNFIITEKGIHTEYRLQIAYLCIDGDKIICSLESRSLMKNKNHTVVNIEKYDSQQRLIIDTDNSKHLNIRAIVEDKNGKSLDIELEDKIIELE